jgi:hypothetical protein
MSLMLLLSSSALALRSSRSSLLSLPCKQTSFFSPSFLKEKVVAFQG